MGNIRAASMVVSAPDGMDASIPTPERLSAWPLWRLLVLLADVERDVGASSSTANAVARIVNQKLRDEHLKAVVVPEVRT